MDWTRSAYQLRPECILYHISSDEVDIYIYVIYIHIYINI